MADDLPKPPRGVFNARLRRKWYEIAKIISDQGINPWTRADLITDFMRMIGEEEALEAEYDDALLYQRIAIGRRFSAILSAKLRVRKLLFAPERINRRKSGADETAA